MEPHLKKHAGGFSDMHLMMSCLGSKRYDQAEQLIETLDKDEPAYAVTSTVLSAMYNHERGRDHLVLNTFRNWFLELFLLIKIRIIRIILNSLLGI